MKSVRKATQPRRTSFPRTVRLLKPIEFKRVFKKNVVSSDGFFRVLGRLNNGPCSRLGMAVSRQVDKRAVGRNRIKRVIRESFRHSWNDSNPYVDLVVLPRRESATICNKQLFQSLEDHWLRVNKTLKKQSAGRQAPRPVTARAKQDAGTV